MPIDTTIEDADRRELAEMLAYLLETWHLLAEPPSRLITPERQRAVWTAWVEMLDDTVTAFDLATASVPLKPGVSSVKTFSGLMLELRRSLHPGRAYADEMEALFCAIAGAIVRKMDQDRSAKDTHGLRGHQLRAKSGPAWGYLYALRALGHPASYAPSDLASHHQYLHAARKAYEAFKPTLTSVLSVVPGAGAVGEAVDLVENALKSGSELDQEMRGVLSGKGWKDRTRRNG